MNGSFFTLDLTLETITSRNGKYLSHYKDTWVLSKEPERSETASGYGTTDEWEAIFDLDTETWIPVTQKSMKGFTVIGAEIVDVNVVGPYVDYVIQYKVEGKNLYYRDRNIDGVFSTADYSVSNVDNYTESILGAYDKDQKYIKVFNSSVMLYDNLRMVINGETPVSYSWTLLPNRIGTILIPFGDLEEDTLPLLFTENQKTYILSKNSDGFIRVIRLGTDISERIIRVAQYVHKINTVDTKNILIERDERITLEVGSLDWNNKFEIINLVTTSATQENKTYYVNSGYNPQYERLGKRSVSMIVTDTVFNLYGNLYPNDIPNGYYLSFYNTDIEDESIDVFYGTEPLPPYKYSLFNGGQIFNGLLDSLTFPSGVIVPFPIGTVWNMQNEVVAIGQLSRGLLVAGMTQDNKTLDAYFYANTIYFGQAAFDLFGVQYTFDGDYIYEGSTRIAIAFGYLFIGCDNSSAYFYNKWDKSVYQFNGSRNLLKIINLSNRTMVKTGRYDGFSGEMVLLTEDEILKNRDLIIMDFQYIPGNNIIPTKKGPYVEMEDGSYTLLSPRDGDIDPFELITEFIGVDGSTVCNYDRIDIRLYSPEKKPLDFVVEMQTINQDTKKSHQKQIRITGNDWSIDGYKTVKLIPEFKKGNGLSLRIYCKQLIYVTNIEFSYDPVAQTANSARSGF